MRLPFARPRRGAAPAADPAPARTPSGTLGTSGGAPPGVPDPILDAIGAMLAAAGRYALPDGATPPHAARLAADRWRRHLSTGLGHPGGDGHGAIPRGPALADRDWAGAAQFVVEQRRAEYEHTDRTLRDFREAIWTLVQGLGTLLEAEQLAGRDSLAAVERVRAAITDADAGAVRRAALDAVGELRGALEGRARERGAHVRVLGTQMSHLDAALRDAGGGVADPLTGLGGRAALEQAAAQAAALRALWGGRVCLALVAVESLDAARAAGGAASVDEVVLHVAAALARVVLRKGDAVFRAGEGTFAVLLGATGAADAIPLLERIPAQVAPEHAGATCALTVALAELGADELAPAWLARAERALDAERPRAAAGELA